MSDEDELLSIDLWRSTLDGTGYVAVRDGCGWIEILTPDEARAVAAALIEAADRLSGPTGGE